MCNIKILFIATLALIESNVVESGIPKPAAKTGSRQKRLLFFDEEGSLVKTYKNPYLSEFTQNIDKIPFLSNFFNPFFSVLRPSYGSPTAYMIPVSEDVIQHINKNPVYQNKLFTLPRKDLVIEPNPLCNGKRSQIPTKNCNNFLNCWDGWAFEQQCPEGLLFSKEGYCDYPHNVDCFNRFNEPLIRPIPVLPIQPVLPMPIQPAPPIQSIPGMPQACFREYQAFRNEEQCNEFFICVNHMPVRFTCPADLAYNPELGICDYASRVNCSDSVVTIAETSDTKPCASDDEGSSTGAGMHKQVRTPGAVSEPKVVSNSVINTQSWNSTHVATSRQDAIRQLHVSKINP